MQFCKIRTALICNVLIISQMDGRKDLLLPQLPYLISEVTDMLDIQPLIGLLNRFLTRDNDWRFSECAFPFFSSDVCAEHTCIHPQFSYLTFSRNLENAYNFEQFFTFQHKSSVLWNQFWDGIISLT